ncbi:MAG: WYL domain-containing protein, partial [Burkholderiales bacterium]
AAQAVAAAVPEKPAGPQRWAQVHLPIESLDQAARLVMSLAPEAEALGPETLRARVAEWAGELARRHAVA